MALLTNHLRCKSSDRNHFTLCKGIKRTRRNAIDEFLDYQIPVNSAKTYFSSCSLAKGTKGKWRWGQREMEICKGQKGNGDMQDAKRD